MLKIKKKDWIEIVLHIAFWVGVFFTLLSFTEPHIKMRINQHGSILEKDIRHVASPRLFLTLGFVLLLFYSNILWLLKKVLRYKNVLIRVALPVAWLAIVFMADSYLERLLPAQKGNDPVLFMPPPAKQFIADTSVKKIFSRVVPDKTIKREVELLHSNTFIFARDGVSDIILFVFIIIFGLSVAYFFLKEWARAEQFRSQLETVQLDTEIKFLKSQVNPHFLFNTLNNLFSMAQKKGADDLADGISKLSGMMRYMIYESNAGQVPLKNEIAYLEDCLTLNKLRYADDEAIVSFTSPADTSGVFIAPMLFIPFVENAFKHGILIGASSPIGISIYLSDMQLIFTCENINYRYIKKMEAEKSGIGLENVKRRLELLYPGKHRLLINDSDEKYMVKLEIELT